MYIGRRRPFVVAPSIPYSKIGFGFARIASTNIANPRGDECRDPSPHRRHGDGSRDRPDE